MEINFRSRFEKTVAHQIISRGHEVMYERIKLKYTVPSVVATYTPDFILPNGIIIESKGRLTLSDRKKMVLIKQQHPKLDVRFVFMKAWNRISKTSATTYWTWCVDNGYQWADREIPKDWFLEEPALENVEELRRLGWI